MKHELRIGEFNQMKIREWAYKNACALIVTSIFFVITWIIIVGAQLWTVYVSGK